MANGGGQLLVGLKIPGLASKQLFHNIVFENISKLISITMLWHNIY